MTTYESPTFQQAWDARNIVFMADVREVMQNTYRVFGMEITMDVTVEGRNTERRIHATTGDGTKFTQAEGMYVHPNSSPEDVAYYLNVNLRSATGRK